MINPTDHLPDTMSCRVYNKTNLLLRRDYSCQHPSTREANRHAKALECLPENKHHRVCVCWTRTQ